MKATQSNFARSAARAAKECRVFFFCGPDEAGASAAADRIVSLLDDPGERVDIAGPDLRRDPVLLGDEARSTSLFGDKRHIRVRASGDEAHDALQLLLESDGDGDPSPVLVVATSATDKSRSAKLVAKHSAGFVGMFYPPDVAQIAGEVRRMGDAAGVSLNGMLAERIARAAGLDVRLAASEVEKLALYLGAEPQSPRPATSDALDAIGAATEEDGFMPLVNTVLAGDVRRLPEELRRMREVSLNPVGLLLAFERRAAQLAALAARLRPGTTPAKLVAAEKQARRIFWKDERDLIAQLTRWRGKRLDRLVERLMALHRSLLTNNRAAELLLAQELTAIARFAAQAKR